MDTAAGRLVAVPDGRQAVSTLVALLKFTKDLVVSRRRFVSLLLAVGGTFGWLGFRVSSRERHKVRGPELWPLVGCLSRFTDAPVCASAVCQLGSTDQAARDTV